MAKIELRFNAKENIITVESINAPQDREKMHEAFRIALQHSKFDMYAETDTGEHKDARPIRKDKESLTDVQTQRNIE